jgi:predicted phosphodiesterase
MIKKINLENLSHICLHAPFISERVDTNNLSYLCLEIPNITQLFEERRQEQKHKYQAVDNLVSPKISDSFNLAFFGCWNTGCDPDSDQKRVVNMLKEDKFDMLIVTGDNIYFPDKNNKTDMEGLIDRGFSCFDGLSRPIYITLGNHDIENYKEKCDILEKQKHISHIKNINLVDNNKQVIINKDTFKINILMVDTNYFFSDEKGSKQCYKNINYKEKANETITWIENHIIDNSHNILIGHHPIYYLGRKNKNKGQIDSKFTDLNFHSMLDRITANNKLTYLCADEHLYQEFYSNNFIQIISGTGGTKLDPVQLKGSGQFKNKDLRFSDGIEKHGYTKLCFNKNSVNFKFIQ